MAGDGEYGAHHGHRERRDDRWLNRLTRPEVLFSAIGAIFMAGVYYTQISDGIAKASDGVNAANVRISNLEKIVEDQDRRYQHIENSLVRIEAHIGLDGEIGKDNK